MSTFVIAATTVTFTADQEGFSERYDHATGLRIRSLPITLDKLL